MERMTAQEFKDYNNKKTYNKYNISDKSYRTWEGHWRGRNQKIVFDSKKEMERFCELLLLRREGMIDDLQRQERFLLIDASKSENKKDYVSDFSYFSYEANCNCWVVEDVKSVHTAKLNSYKINKKLFKKKYPKILFKEIL